MRSPQLQRLVDVNEIPVLDEAGIEAFAQQHPQVMLYFSEDPDRYPEANDVAMVVPELVKAFPGHLAAAIVDERVERELKLQHGFRRWPALVFLRGEGYLGAITEMQNWDDYLHQVQAILAAEVSKPPLALLDVSNADS